MKYSELTKNMRWHIADRLSQQRLDKVNAIVKDAVPNSSFYGKYVKRGLDVAVALTALTVTLPVNAVIGVVTYFDVGSPVFFRQERLGRNGKVFTITKFRNMKEIYDENGELLPPEKRVTAFGKFVRKTSLDELLNFWSILKGDMSVIGPRPLVPEYKHRFNKRHAVRMAVRPGLECPPRKRIDHVWSWQEQFENDVWYAQNVSFATDCKMVLALVRYAMDRKNIKARSNVTRGSFCGYDENGKAITYEELTADEIEELLR